MRFLVSTLVSLDDNIVAKFLYAFLAISVPLFFPYNFFRHLLPYVQYKSYWSLAQLVFLLSIYWHLMLVSLYFSYLLNLLFSHAFLLFCVVS